MISYASYVFSTNFYITALLHAGDGATKNNFYITGPPWKLCYPFGYMVLSFCITLDMENKTVQGGDLEDNEDVSGTAAYFRKSKLHLSYNNLAGGCKLIQQLIKYSI